ncbi:MAG: hypothetical protein L0338_14000 [Acidobacteria bacterium]|nr:hypothetical protein [Acidobacteriota bacterium]
MEPGVVVMAGKTAEIKANIVKPRNNLEFIWRAERGTLNPQHSTRYETTYLAPPLPGQDRVFLEIREGTRTLWNGDVILDVTRGEEPTASTPRPSATGYVTQPLTVQTLTIASFSEPVPLGPFYTPGQGWAETAVVVDRDPARGRVARLAYDVSQTGDYAGLYVRFRAPNFRPEEWPALTFWLRGDSGGYTRKLKVELKTREVKSGWKIIYINLTDQWQRFHLRLSDFQPFGSWDSMDEFVLTIENHEATAPKGVLFLDDVAFER